MLALKTGKLNDIPVFGFFFHIAQDVLTMIANIISAWENLQRLLGGGKSGGRSGGGASGGGGGGGGEGDVISAQHGFAGLVTRPTLFLAGEGHRPEYVSVTPRGSAGTPVQVHTHISLDGNEIAEALSDIYLADMRGKGRGLG